MLLASKSCFVLLLAFYVTTPYSLYVAEEEGGRIFLLINIFFV